ncbi:hypothetical protein [Flavobacterium sp. LB2P44]|uniref:hypothetical protein n=1 Tax=Flavobacterium sp. LB2P44 TaxID=3401713 RepID=UPI003AAF8E17
MFKNYFLSPDDRGLFSPVNSTDHFKNNLKGKVKTVINTKNKFSNLPFAPTQKQMFEISEFDERGELTSYRETDQRDQLYLKKEYLYENGLLKSELVFDEDDMVVEAVYFKHNSQNLMIEEFRKDYDVLLTGIYDDSGYLKVVKQFSELQGDDREFKIFRDSNTKTNITEIEIYDKNNLSRKSNYKYNSRNNVASTESFSPNGDTFSTEEIQYDDNDNILKLVHKDKRRTTEYSYRYDYDKLGNWIKFEFAVNGEVKSESKREIRYYQFS